MCVCACVCECVCVILVYKGIYDHHTSMDLSPLAVQHNGHEYQLSDIATPLLHSGLLAFLYLNMFSDKEWLEACSLAELQLQALSLPNMGIWPNLGSLPLSLCIPA